MKGIGLEYTLIFAGVLLLIVIIVFLYYRAKSRATYMYRYGS